MPALRDTPWHGEPSEQQKLIKESCPKELPSKLWWITGLDLYYLTMGKIAK